MMVGLATTATSIYHNSYCSSSTQPLAHTSYAACNHKNSFTLATVAVCTAPHTLIIEEKRKWGESSVCALWKCHRRVPLYCSSIHAKWTIKVVAPFSLASHFILPSHFTVRFQFNAALSTANSCDLRLLRYSPYFHISFSVAWSFVLC